MPARRPRRLARLMPLAALVLLPSALRAQASSSVFARATVAPASAPRLTLSFAEAPVATAATRAATAADGTSASVLVRSAVHVAGNAGYRLFVRVRTGADGAGIEVRDASGTFRTLDDGAAIEVARGGGSGAVSDVVYRLDDEAAGAAATELPIVYELVYDPVS